VRCNYFIDKKGHSNHYYSCNKKDEYLSKL
jgi:hypothetical protein